MSEDVKNQYSPDWVSPPGETLLEVLTDRGMGQSELATRTGRPKKTINEIVQGKASITPDTALQLELVLGIPAAFWNAREALYREFLARQRGREDLEDQQDWLRDVPYAELVKLGWLAKHKEKAARVEEALRFFGVASVDSLQEVWAQPQATFRRSERLASRVGALMAWLRKGELEAQRLSPGEYREDLFRKVLTEIRSLTRKPHHGIGQAIAEHCARAGVVVVHVPEVPGARVWGATRWMSPSRPLIQLSLRYKTDDHFWFTFFHEAAHILLHGKRAVFVEEEGGDTGDRKEQEADGFAADWLIPPPAYARFAARRDFTDIGIRRFAHQLGIAPGIVVGRLQHDKLVRPDRFYDLKQKVVWS